ncbi:MAG: response regulator [Candidatus Aminicenantes bacterium]|nr:MAG: response regulator [Candidatus Aminicenantes bacterium]
MSESKKIVVVDDDLKVTILVKKKLTEKGFQVFSTNDGTKALELVENEKPDVLVTDILQPGLDGVSLCNSIKNHPTLGDTKVIIISGVYNEANFRLQMDCQPDGFVEKPIDVNQLGDVVMEKIKECI